MSIDINKTLEIFRKESVEKAEAHERGDYKAANKSYDKIIKAVTTLKDSNSVAALLDLLNDPRPAVKMTAAIFLLPTYEEISLPILKEIAAGIGIMAFTAEMTIEEWQKGHLKDYLS